MQSKLSDPELIQLTINGDQSAYACLVKRHQRFVFTLAMRFVKRREEAEEVAQDCFVKAYRGITSFHGQSKFTTWLYSIVYTTAMTYLRKKNRTTESIHDEGIYQQAANYTAMNDTNTAEIKSSSFYLNQAIEQLLPDDAAVISLFYKGEQSLEETGQIMGLTANTVKVKLFRARQRLKEKLENSLKHEAREML